MVMRSFKRIKLEIEVDKAKIKDYVRQIESEFGHAVNVGTKDSYIIVEGEGLSDYHIHDKILFILTGGKYGSNV